MEAVESVSEFIFQITILGGSYGVYPFEMAVFGIIAESLKRKLLI